MFTCSRNYGLSGQQLTPALNRQAHGTFQSSYEYVQKTQFVNIIGDKSPIIAKYIQCI
jgi:hypothetical protein